MSDFLLANEPVIRLGAFLAILALMILWEALAPCRDRRLSRWIRWPNNFAIVAVNTLVLRLLLPTAAVGLAVIAESRGWGLFNALSVPAWFAILASIILLDLAIYLQHVMFHAVPALWRLHRMHHADLDFDVTTGARFHPIEILLSMVIKLAVVAALGPPAVAVLIFEVLLNATAMFNHGNVSLPPALDRPLRWIIVTPDMHRVHHSIHPDETNSNFGFNLPWWDRFCGTYRLAPRGGHQAMQIGLDRFQNARDTRLDQLLVQPFRGGVGNYPINRRSDDT